MTAPIAFSPSTSLTDADRAALRMFVAELIEADGRPEVPAAGDGLPGEFHGGTHLLARRAGELVGYAHLDPAGDSFGRQVAELFVRPKDRRQGIGAALLTELVELAGKKAQAPAGDSLRVWSHGDHPAAARLAETHRFRRVREMLRLRRPLTAGEFAAPTLPDGVRLRAFVPGQDEEALVRVNHRAFDWHPEQGALTVAEVRATEREDWFDPAGFFLAVDAEDTLLGFHWTKVHARGAAGDQPPGVPMGEVYVVGVDPAAQGGGLGRALTQAGLRYLADVRRLDRVMLYVESDNAPAIAVYRRLGFTTWDVDVQYTR